MQFDQDVPLHQVQKKHRGQSGNQVKSIFTDFDDDDDACRPPRKINGTFGVAWNNIS